MPHCADSRVGCRWHVDVMCHGTWHGMADVSSHLVTVLACSVSEGCICRLLSTQPEIRLFEDYSPARSSCGSWRLTRDRVTAVPVARANYYRTSTRHRHACVQNPEFSEYFHFLCHTSLVTARQVTAEQSVTRVSHHTRPRARRFLFLYSRPFHDPISSTSHSITLTMPGLDPLVLAARV